MLAGPPAADDAVPEAVAALAGDRPVRPVWLNAVGGSTFEVGRGPDRVFVKWTPPASGIDLPGEAARMAWLAQFTPVPTVLGGGSDGAGSWLVTSPLPGETAVSPRWKTAPAVAVRAIGKGLRRLHDLCPVGECPFSWSAEERIALAHQRAASGETDVAEWHQCHRSLTIDAALARLAEVPPVDRLVVCHGDACAPNTIVDEHGRCAGHVDLGSAGTGDRWADLAVATWSTDWNYGPGWEQTLLEAYGIEEDAERTRYYRLLWDLA